MLPMVCRPKLSLDRLLSIVDAYSSARQYFIDSSTATKILNMLSIPLSSSSIMQLSNKRADDGFISFSPFISTYCAWLRETVGGVAGDYVVVVVVVAVCVSKRTNYHKLCS